MKSHRFVGATSREVLNKVKHALGDDALIVSNRTHDGEIEVVALSAADISPDESSAFAPAKRIEFRERVALAEAARAPAIEAQHAPEAAPLVGLVAPVLTPPLAATSAIASAASSLAAFAAAAVTRSTASPAMVTPAVVTRSAASPSVMSWAPVIAPQPQPAAPAPVADMVSIPAAPEIASVAAAPVVASVPAAPSLLSGSAAPAQTPAPVAPAIDAQASRGLDGILHEIKSLKSVLQRDIAALGSAESPEAIIGRAGVMHELLNAGFSAQLARQVSQEVCSLDTDPMIDDIAQCLEREVWLAGTDEIINRGGVYALVGPTGVGKTTTVAKLAARAVVRFGAAKVALLTTDSYRVGAHDQLRIYGRILSVPVHAIRDAQDLAHVLEELKDRHLVLIDTIGMSQRDRMVAEQAAMLAGAGDVKRLLLVQTTANARTLEQVVTAYKKAGVDGCILTKTDEAGSIAPALDVIIRHQLPLHYVTDGQCVPEDLQLPDAGALIREALKPCESDAFDIAPEEMAFMIPAIPANASAGVSHG